MGLGIVKLNSGKYELFFFFFLLNCPVHVILHLLCPFSCLDSLFDNMKIM